MRTCSCPSNRSPRNCSSNRPKSRSTSTRARAKLLAIRSKRVWPGLDDKVLTSWNALAIRGLAIAARSLDKPEFAAAAERALDFVRAHLWRPDPMEGAGCWPPPRMASRISMPTSTTTRTSLTRCSRCCSSAGATRMRPGCAQILDAMLEHFEDAKLGGFFFTSDDHEALIHRSKSFSDDAIPAGNGIAARALIRAGYLLGETRWLTAAERTLRAALARHQPFPARAHEPARSAGRISGPAGDRDHSRARRTRPPGSASSASCTRRIAWCFRFPRISRASTPPGGQESRARATRAYVCRGSTCSAPVESLADLIRTAQARIEPARLVFLRRFASARLHFFFADLGLAFARRAPAVTWPRCEASATATDLRAHATSVSVVLDDVGRAPGSRPSPLPAVSGTA